MGIAPQPGQAIRALSNPLPCLPTSRPSRSPRHHLHQGSYPVYVRAPNCEWIYQQGYPYLCTVTISTHNSSVPAASASSSPTTSTSTSSSPSADDDSKPVLEANDEGAKAVVGDIDSGTEVDSAVEGEVARGKDEGWDRRIRASRSFILASN